MPAFLPGLVGPAPSPEARLFLARGLELAVGGEEGAAVIPTFAELGARAGTPHFLGSLDGVPCYAAAPEEDSLPQGLRWVAARALFGAVDEASFAAAGRAIAIAEWDRTHRFCGRCGARTALAQGERAFRCQGCELSFYPRIAPAVIVLVEREGEALLARGVQFPPGRYSTLAGFVEAGESLEEAVHREVLEEVGVRLAELRYFGSQPWPFGRSLMVGFTARWAEGEIRCDPKEIVDARWFRASELPQLPPRISIAHQLISAWRARSNGAG